MYSSTILTLALATAALAQSTVNPVSQIADGQPQAPTGVPSGPGPEIISTALPTETTPYTNAFTSYLSMTDSLGVVTGMPSVVTSQPAAVTEQPVSPTLPSYSGYAYGNSTTVGVMASTMQTVASATQEASASASAPEQQSGSASASATVGQSTGSAEVNRVAGCGVALMVLGVGFSLL